MAQLLEFLPSYDQCKKVGIKEALEQEREHAAHCTVPLSLDKCVIWHILIAKWQLQVLMPAKVDKL